jgi:hypothetical protein
VQRCVVSIGTFDSYRRLSKQCEILSYAGGAGRIREVPTVGLLVGLRPKLGDDAEQMLASPLAGPQRSASTLATFRRKFPESRPRRRITGLEESCEGGRICLDGGISR